MTDDTSKVLCNAADLCMGTGKPEWPHNCSCPKHTATPAEATPKLYSLESVIAEMPQETQDAIEARFQQLKADYATTPAAINPASVDNQFTYSPIEPPYRLTPAITTDGHAGVALDPEGSYTYYDDYATLARQLAEAKERMRELEAQRDDYLNREWVAEKAKRKAESQLAEAEEDRATARRAAIANEQEAERLGVQLAEATRRLGEVEKEAATERALQRAAKELPEGWDVCVYVEQGSGWVELRNPDLDTVEFDRDDYSLAEQIASAIDAARATGEGEGHD